MLNTYKKKYSKTKINNEIKRLKTLLLTYSFSEQEKQYIQNMISDLEKEVKFMRY